MLLHLYLAGELAAAAFPFVVAHAHIAKVLVRSVAGDAPRQRVALWAFVALWRSGAQRLLQHFHALAQCCNFVGCSRNALPRGPVVQQPQYRIECAHV